MIKNIYIKERKEYEHDYHCDNCFRILNFEFIYRNELAIQAEKFDLCYDCKQVGDKKEKEGNK